MNQGYVKSKTTYINHQQKIQGVMNYLLESVYIDEQRMKQGYVILISNFSFLPPRVKLKQSCSNKEKQTRFILNEGKGKIFFKTSSKLEC
jgi:hypothetical protein